MRGNNDQRKKQGVKKIGFPYEYLGEVENTDFWAEGIIIRRFRFPRKFQQEGIQLNN